MLSISQKCTISVVALCLVSVASAAPTDQTTTLPPSQETSTPASTLASTSTPVSTPAPSESSTKLAKSLSTRRKDDDDIQASGSFQNTSTFSCWGRQTGYYADVKLGCNIYHFCTQMEGIGGVTTYQRMSYVCMDGSLFDQKDLNCVMKKDMKVPCDKAEAEYESSNGQFGYEETQPSVSENLAANLMMNPIARFIAGR